MANKIGIIGAGAGPFAAGRVYFFRKSSQGFRKIREPVKVVNNR